MGIHAVAGHNIARRQLASELSHVCAQRAEVEDVHGSCHRKLIRHADDCQTCVPATGQRRLEHDLEPLASTPIGFGGDNDFNYEFQTLLIQTFARG